MKRRMLFLIIGISVSATVFSQAVPDQMRNRNLASRMVNSSPFMMREGIPLPPGKVIGSALLDSAWKQGTVLLFKNSQGLDVSAARYNIASNQLEVKSENRLIGVDGRLIRSFVLIDHQPQKMTYFLNADSLIFKDEPIGGLMEVMVDGQIPLLKGYSVTLKKPTYNVALDVGSRDSEYIKKESLYYLKGKTLNRVPKEKKDFVKIFEDKATEIEKYISSNPFNARNEADLCKLFEYFNTLK